MKLGKPTFGGIPWWGILLLLLLPAAVVESWRGLSAPPQPLSRDTVRAELQRAADLFEREQQQLLDRSRSLADLLAPNILRMRSGEALSRLLEPYRDLWGITVTEGDSTILWHGYTPPPATVRSGEGARLRIAQYNNVLFWESRVPFTVRDSSGLNRFELIAGKRIIQTNPLPIGTGSEYHFTSRLENRSQLPIEIRLLSSAPDSLFASATLHNLQGDSTGLVFVESANALSRAGRQWEAGTRLWRSLYLLFAYMILGLLFYSSYESGRPWRELASRGGIIILGWALVRLLEIPERVLGYLQAGSGQFMLPAGELTLFLVDALAVFLLAFTLYHGLKDRAIPFRSNSFLSTLSLSTLAGVLSSVLMLGLLNRTYLLMATPGLPLDDLHLFPSVSTLLLYLGLGMMFGGLILLLGIVIRVMLYSSRAQLNLPALAMFIGFSLSIGGIYLAVPAAVTMDYTFLYSILLFGLLLGGLRFVMREERTYLLSSVRGIALGSILIALAAAPVMQQALHQRTESRLAETAAEFSSRSDEQGGELTYDLLSSLGEVFSGINTDSLANRRLFPGSRFNEVIDRFIASRGGDYSYDLQIITGNGDQVAGYSTDLNSPSWPSIFSLAQLQAVVNVEQITRSNLRPVVQQNPQLITAKEYESFHRGWIPLFGPDSDEPTAWILASVYRERPNFDKPMRAVLVAHSYADWKESFSLAEYRQGELVRSSRRGITGYYPVPNKLQPGLAEALSGGSPIYRTEETELYTYRSYYRLTGDERVIRASTILPGFRNRLYNYFRFNFVLLLIGLGAVVLREVLRPGPFRFLEKSRFFRYRLLDRFLLAVLLFLGVLVLTTHYAIRQQNKEVVRQSLYQKMDNLGRQVQQQIAGYAGGDGDRATFLDSLTTPLDVDATLYRGRSMVQSTTPQIYRQNLLPEDLPYGVYQQLYRSGQNEAFRQVELASQQMLIGYRAILSENREPVAAVAIPTFLQSPKFEQQLLETTSYLILIYLIIFGAFIIGSMLITRELTEPLAEIRRGLGRLSRGDLDATIPVAGDDEIGQLAGAYNEMIRRLREARRELTVAEREAAWKEMAQQVAHEIKNPLTPMKLSVQHLERQISGGGIETGELKPRIRKIAKNLIEQIETLNSIASDFSRFSQPVDGDFEEVNLNAVMKSVYELYSGDEQVSMDLELSGFPLIVSGADDELRRVVVNLVKNAFEAMPGEGTVRLRSYQKKGSAFLEVEDSGKGIPDSHRNRIFVPNFSTKSSGTGLGLAISKKVIEAHGGSISFASIEGQGTTFVIKLPLK